MPDLQEKSMSTAIHHREANATKDYCAMSLRSARLKDQGITTIESVIVLSLLGIVLLGVTALHMLAVSTGTAAEASSIATNLARARLEELLALPPSEILQQNNTEQLERVSSGQGRTYTVRTTVDAHDPTRLDITVRVTWVVAYNSACASWVPGVKCTPHTVTYTRTLQTRIYRPGIS
jgi:Tfp pilus assembly protein PilV